MIRTAPLNHQKSIVRFCSPLTFAGICAYYGTGKSLAGLWLIEKNKWKTIVIVSSKTALESTWEDEIKKHSDYRYALVVGDLRQKLNIIREAMYRRSPHHTLVLLVNIDGVRNIIDSLTAIKPDAVILDESLLIKNYETLRSKVMWEFGRRVPRRYIMAGNIFSESLTEVYSQVKFLDNGKTFGNSYKSWLKKYFVKKRGKYTPKEGAAEEIFKLINPFFIMIPESVVERPPVVRKQIKLTATDQQRKLITQLEEGLRIEVGKVNVSTDNVYALYGKCQQICDGHIADKDGNIVYINTSKDEALIDTLEEIGKEKIIVWVKYVATIKKLYKILTKAGYGVLTLYGQTKIPSGDIVKRFQLSPKYQVLLMTLDKGNASITLTASRIGYYYSRDWSFDKRGNSEARISRKGSLEMGHKDTLYIDSYIKDSVEQIMHECVQTKGDVVKALRKYFKVEGKGENHVGENSI